MHHRPSRSPLGRLRHSSARIFSLSISALASLLFSITWLILWPFRYSRRTLAGWSNRELSSHLKLAIRANRSLQSELKSSRQANTTLADKNRLLTADLSASRESNLLESRALRADIDRRDSTIIHLESEIDRLRKELERSAEHLAEQHALAEKRRDLLENANRRIESLDTDLDRVKNELSAEKAKVEVFEDQNKLAWESLELVSAKLKAHTAEWQMREAVAAAEKLRGGGEE